MCRLSPAPTVVSLVHTFCPAALFGTVTLIAGAAPTSAQLPLYGAPIVETYAAPRGDRVTAYSVAQAPDGTLFAGENSLWIGDGDRWSNARANAVKCIYGIDAAADGKIWIAAEADAGWFNRTSAQEWSYTSVASDFTDAPIRGQVWRVFATTRGIVFITADTVYRWSPGRPAHWALPGAKRLTAFRVGDDVYVAHAPTGIYRVAADGLQLVVPQSALATGRLVLDLQRVDERWIYLTSDGIMATDGEKSADVASAANDILKKTIPTCGARLPDGRLVYGTLQGGIVVVSPSGELLEHIAQNAGAPANIFAIFVDREGQVWASSPAALTRINPSIATRVFDTRSGLPRGKVSAIAATDGVVLALGAEAMYALGPDKHQFARVETYGSLVHDVSVAGEDVIVSGYGHVWRHNVSGISTAIDERYDVQSVLVNADGQALIAATHDGGLREYSSPNNGSAITGRLPVTPTTLARDDAGNLWAGTDTQGAFVLRRGADVFESAARYLGKQLLKGRSIVRSTAGGAVTIITRDGAWTRARGVDAFEPVRGFPQRELVAASGVLPDGSLWILQGDDSSAEVVCGKISGGKSPAWNAHTFSGAEAIGRAHSIAAKPLRSGETELWIGGDMGILRDVVAFDPSEYTPPAPQLRAFTRSKEGDRVSLPHSIAYATPGVDFEFSVPTFAYRSAVRLESRLDGVDGGWLQVPKQGLRELLAPREGQYMFRVRAVTSGGRTGPEAQYSFAVTPPWWRSGVGIAVECGLTVLLGFGAVQWRVRSLRRKNAELERKVRLRTHELEVANAAKTQFVANMSHDIRNPLSGICGLTVALEGTAVDAQQREIIRTLRDCTTYLSTLVDDVLDFAKIEAGQIELRPVTYRVPELLNAVKQTLAGQIQETGSFVTLASDPDIPPLLWGDAGRIQQICVNYLSNALKYSPGDIQLSAAVRDGEIEFSVQDHGAGISLADQQMLFAKFGRLESARKSNIKGTGLGLAACHHVAKAMHGRVGVESTPPMGARFFLRLPLVPAEATAAATSSQPNPLPTSILLVEDEDYNAQAASAVLRTLGLTCDRARTGTEALEVFMAKRHAIVLLDRNLPDMDGTEVARQIRNIETNGMRALILAVTAYCTAEERQVCLDAGMDAFVGKPFTPEKLRSALLLEAERAGPQSVRPVESPPAASGDSEQTTLDLSLLRYLAQGKADGLAGELDRFCTLLRSSHDQLVELCPENFDAIADTAHKLLNHGRMIGAGGLNAAAIALEDAARKRQAGDVANARQRVAAQIDALIAEVRAVV